MVLSAVLSTEIKRLHVAIRWPSCIEWKYRKEYELLLINSFAWIQGFRLGTEDKT